MANKEKSRVLAKLIQWHLTVALRLVGHLIEALLGGSDPSQEDPATLAPAEEGSVTSGPASGELGPGLDAYKALLEQERIEQVQKGAFVTNDIVIVLGRLGTLDHREVRINGNPPLKMERRLHAMLVIWAQFARYASEARQAGREHMPTFLPVKPMLEVIKRLSGVGGPLAGQWRAPTADDVHRLVGKLRDLLEEAGLNRNLIESGPPGTGYRISSLPSTLIPDEAAEAWA